MYRSYPNLLFSKGSIEVIFQKIYANIKASIDSESEDYILNVNEITYAEHLESKSHLSPPEIHFDQVYADSYEDDIPAEYFPMTYHVYQGKTYKQSVIQYFIPCSGDINLLNYCASNIIFMGSGGRFHIDGKTIVTEIIKFSQSAEELKRISQTEVNNVHKYYISLIKDIENFNQTLNGQIMTYFTTRKNKLLSNRDLLSSLGVPLRKKDSTPSTFSVPNPQVREKIQISKPVVHEKGYKPEPSLDDKTYQRILKLINDVGKNFERMPSVYKEKGEEDLRDHILMTIDPNFELGSASGETFNKTGKTDILIRYDSSVIFIAECKYWSGEKNYLLAIDQLLSYLIWRNTKTALIVFVRQKEFSTILEKVSKITQEHPNYLRFINNQDENWFNYSFHINDDKNREVKLTVLLYHLPKQ